MTLPFLACAASSTFFDIMLLPCHGTILSCCLLMAGSLSDGALDFFFLDGADTGTLAGLVGAAAGGSSAEDAHDMNFRLGMSQ
jgi:hypothetical protein